MEGDHDDALGPGLKYPVFVTRHERNPLEPTALSCGPSDHAGATYLLTVPSRTIRPAILVSFTVAMIVRPSDSEEAQSETGD